MISLVMPSRLTLSESLHRLSVHRLIEFLLLLHAFRKQSCDVCHWEETSRLLIYVWCHDPRHENYWFFLERHVQLRGKKRERVFFNHNLLVSLLSGKSQAVIKSQNPRHQSTLIIIMSSINLREKTEQSSTCTRREKHNCCKNPSHHKILPSTSFGGSSGIQHESRTSQRVSGVVNIHGKNGEYNISTSIHRDGRDERTPAVPWLNRALATREEFGENFRNRAELQRGKPTLHVLTCRERERETVCCLRTHVIHRVNNFEF